MDSLERLSDEAQDQLKKAILDADGSEVFAAGKIGASGLVEGVIIAARGNKHSVPALRPYLESGDVLIHNHPSGVLEPSDADLEIASREGAKGIGSYIVNNSVTKVYVIAEAIAKKKIKKIPPKKLSEVIDTNGPLSKSLSTYEPRQSQIGLLELITESFNSSCICAAEAGTGVGKSIAYLVPAMSWAITNDERVVISTGTINLQQQLIEKDIPKVQSIMKKQIKAVLVKGRSNYLCLTRMKEAIEEESLLFTPDSELGQIEAWSKTSKDGSKSDLAFVPEEGLWTRVCAESDYCLNLKCNNRENCFVLAMKRASSDAHILVTNHHLLFADLRARQSGMGYDGTAILPPFTRIIFDEAHNIESSATSYFSQELNRFSALKQLNRLLHERRERKFGALIRLQNSITIKPKLFKKIPDLIHAVKESIDKLDIDCLLLFSDSSNYRLVRENIDLIRSSIFTPLSELERSIIALLDSLQAILDEVQDDDKEDVSIYEIKTIMRRLQDIAGIATQFKVYDETPDQVFWLEKGRTLKGESFTCLNITPLNIGLMMREAVFEPYSTVACVSATLTVSNNFNFWMNRAGLTGYEEKEVISGIFPSPFPYKQNCLLAVPEDAPMSDEAGYQDFINDAVIKILSVSEGHGLVLFTSYEALKSSYEKAKIALEPLGITIFKQGDDDRSRLMNKFKNDLASVLFATDSFWEGVDAPGETLEVVIIAKLPFQVPTDPIQKARSEAIEKRGGNSFMELSLPEAITKLKQGFGRLMRKTDDYGSVIILDSRLIKKRYGELFLKSLPETRRSIKPLKSILLDLEEFLAEQRSKKEK